MHNPKIILIVGEHYSGKHYFQNLVSKKYPNVQSINIYSDFMQFVTMKNAKQLSTMLSDQIYTVIVPAEIENFNLSSDISKLQDTFGTYNISIIHMKPDIIPMMRHALDNKNLPDYVKIKINTDVKKPGINSYTHDMEYLTTYIHNSFDRTAADHMSKVIEELYEKYQSPIHYDVQEMINFLTTTYHIVHLSSQDENIFHEDIPDTIKTVYYDKQTHLWKEVTKDIIPIPLKFEHIKFYKFMDDVIEKLNTSDSIETRYISRDPNTIYLNTGERYNMITKVTEPADPSAAIGWPIYVNKVPYDVSSLTSEERKIFDYMQNMFGTGGRTGTNIAKTIFKSLMCPAESAGIQIILNCMNDKELEAYKLFYNIMHHMIWYNAKKYTGGCSTAWVYDFDQDNIVETAIIKTDNVLTPLRYNQVILRFIYGPVTVINPNNKMYGVFRPNKLPRHKKLSDDNITHITEQLAAWVMECPDINPNTGNVIGFKDLIL